MSCIRQLIQTKRKLLTMPAGQTNIMSFFAKSTSKSKTTEKDRPQKRTSQSETTINNDENEFLQNSENINSNHTEVPDATLDEPSNKKAKVSGCLSPNQKGNSTLQPPLTPDEKSKIQNNKISAKLKLLNRKTNGQISNIGLTWFDALESELSKDYITELSTLVFNERKKGPVYPPTEQVFTWTTACTIDEVKVVIIGQDPYHGPRQAHGLCFSVLPGIKPPPSLQNIFKELTSSIEGFEHPGHGYLSGWATQGVLLLNACLTVRGGAANSHSGKGWEKLTDAAIRWINSNSSGVVFMLWGAYAQKKGSFINKKKHHVLTSVHPSPLSAHRGFLGCGHFSRCNELLEADGKTPIDWTHLPVDN